MDWAGMYLGNRTTSLLIFLFPLFTALVYLLCLTNFPMMMTATLVGEDEDQDDSVFLISFSLPLSLFSFFVIFFFFFFSLFLHFLLFLRERVCVYSLLQLEDGKRR